MKKYLLWLPVIFLICSSAKYNIKNNKKQPTVKGISLIIYKSIGYTSNVYNNTSAQLQITIEKVSRNNYEVIWDKAFDAKLLREYPALDSAFIQAITIPEVNDSKEHFEVIYTRIYNSNGYTLQIQNAAVIDRNSDNRVDISI